MVDGFSDVDRETLLPIVRRATGRARLEPGSWSVQQLQGGAGRTAGICRVSGEGTDLGEPVSWSLVVKTLAREADAESPDRWNYWRREADAYESGLLDDLPGRLRAPRCVASRELGSDRVELWLEDIEDTLGDWSMAHFEAAASSLGEFNGAHLEKTPAPAGSWLSRDWLRGYVEYNAPMVDLLRRSADDAWVRRMFPPDELSAMLAVWDDREWCFDVLASLPQTVCHMDAFHRNLFRCVAVDGAIDTVAIDWAFVGTGAVGEELVSLVHASAGLGAVDVDGAADLERRVLAGYVDGLSRSGVECDERLVRLGYAVAGCLRYSIGPLETLLPTLLDEQRHDWLVQVFGMELVDICDHVAALRRMLLMPLLPEAHTIERELGLV